MSLTEEQRAEIAPKVTRMVNYFLLKCPQHIDRDDMLSAAWEGVLDAETRYKPGKATFSTYAMIRARGAMIDWFRAEYTTGRGHGKIRHTVEWIDEAPPVTTPPAEYESVLTEVIIKRLKDMPERTQNIFLARFWGDQSFEQIARAHGLAAITVGQILSKEFRKLKKPDYERRKKEDGF